MYHWLATGNPHHNTWIAARNALDRASGEALGTPSHEMISDPVMRVALDQAEPYINHNNALIQAEDKAYLVRTLEELVRGGHRFNVDEVAAYAMATGWSGQEVKRIRECGAQTRRRQTLGSGGGWADLDVECAPGGPLRPSR